MNWVESLARPSIVKLRAYKSARSLVSQADIYLDANEAPGPVPGNLNRYPQPQPPELVKSFAAFYGVNSNQVLVGRGSDEAIDTLTRAFCEPSRDAILITTPTYGMYEVSADIQNAQVIKTPLIKRDGEWTLDVEAMAREAKNKSLKIIYICSPNNPTGTVFSNKDIRAVCEAATNSLVVVDEAYIEFAPETSCVTMLNEFPRLVILRTLSKAWAQAGLRCGVAIGNSELIELLQKVRAPYPLAQPVIEAALKVLEKPEVMRERVKMLQSERLRIARALSELKIVREIFPSHANFLLVRFTNEAAVMGAAQATGMVLRSRHSEPGLENCIRITVGNEAENDHLLKTLSGVPV